MNLSEANAVNQLLTYLLGQRPHSSGHRPTPDEAQAIAEFLALRASVALGAGWRPEEVGAAWKAAKPQPGSRPRPPVSRG